MRSMTSHLSQRARFSLLAVDVAVLIGASWLAYGDLWPANDDRGIWFFTALLGLLLGSRLDTPFFVTPAGVFLYAAPAAVALLLANGWSTWQPDTRIAFSVALGFCALCAALGAGAILTNRVADERWQRVSNACRILAETLGTPRMIYSFVVAFAIYAFHPAVSARVRNHNSCMATNRCFLTNRERDTAPTQDSPGAQPHFYNRH
jgi:hypothetical protein